MPAIGCRRNRCLDIGGSAIRVHLTTINITDTSLCYLIGNYAAGVLVQGSDYGAVTITSFCSAFASDGNHGDNQISSDHNPFAKLR
jgi:hypothetical protein